MAVDVKPSTWFGPGYSVAGHTIIFNTSEATSNPTLLQLLDAKANATTGDFRSVSFSLAEMLYASWLARGTDNQPKNARLARSISGDSSGKITYVYTQQYTLTPGGIFTVVPET